MIDDRGTTIAPVSLEQQRMWTHAQLLGSESAYVLVVAFRFEHTPDEARLQRAAERTVARHESLRSGFRLSGAVLQRFVAAEGRPEVMRLGNVRQDTELVTALLSPPMTLDDPPLIRIGLGSTPDGDTLVIAVHHLVADGWSIENILLELESQYAADVETPDLPPAPTFSDYAGRSPSDGDLTTAVSASSSAFEPASGGIRHIVEPGVEFVDQTRAVAAACGSSSLAVVGALAAAALGAGHGASVLSIGVPIAVRTPEDEAGVGPYLQVGRLQVHLRPGMRFRELCEQIDDALLEEVEHAFAPGREAAGPAHIDVMITETRFATMGIELGTFGRRIDVPPPVSEQPVAIEVRTNPGAEALQVDTDPLQFDADDAANLVARVRRGARRAVADLDVELRTLHAVDGLAPGSSVASPPLTADEVLSARGDRPSWVSDGVTRLDTAAFGHRVSKLCRALRDLGVGPSTLVAIAVHRTVDMPTAFVAVRTLGAAYVAIQPDWPAERRRSVLEAARPSVVISDDSFAAFGMRTPTIRPDGSPASSAEAGAVARTDARVDGAAFIVFTSGTTGVPKGVVVRESAVDALVSAMQTVAPLQPADVFCAVSASAFDLASLEMLWPGTVGAALVVASVGEPPTEPVSALQCTPTVMLLIAKDPRWRRCLAHTRFVILGGEPVGAHHFQVAREMGIHAVYSGYGPSETTVWSALRRIDEAGTAPVIGYPIPGTTFTVVDEWGVEVQRGVAGDLLISGAGVAIGYLDPTEPASRRFVDHRGKPAYRSGDRMIMLSSGELRPLGRQDDQVKVRGQRVELAEVEGAIAKSPDVAAVAVVPATGTGRVELHAFVEPRQDSSTSLAGLRAHAAQLLVDAAVPTRWSILESLPRTTNGKIDRRALLRQAMERTGPSDRADRPTASDQPATVLGLCKEMYPALPFSRESSFRAVGGDSFIAVLVAIEARRRGLDLRAGQLLRDTPLGDIDFEIDATAGPRVDAGQVIPLSAMQRAFFDRARPSHDRANVLAVYQVPHHIDDLRLEWAFRKVVDAHDAFRLRFAATRRGWSQHVAHAAAPSFRVVAEHLGERSEIEHRLRSILDAEQDVIDLADGPTVGALLIRSLDDVGTYLGVFASHLVVDGMSWSFFVHQVASAYADVTPRPTSFATHLRTEGPEAGSTPPHVSPTTVGHRLAAVSLPAHENTIGAAREIIVRLDPAPVGGPGAWLERTVSACARLYRAAGFDDFAVKLTESGREDAADPGTIGWIAYDAVIALPTDPDPAALRTALSRERDVARRRRFQADLQPRVELNVNVLLPSSPPALFGDTIRVDANAVAGAEQRGNDLRVRIAAEASGITIGVQYHPRQFSEHHAASIARAIEGELLVEPAGDA